jgi:hypothetical protein
MNIRLLFLALFIFYFNNIQAQSAWANEVSDHSFGYGQTFGQDSSNFPSNVLGQACIPASTYSPCASPSEVCSLGKDGWITLKFDPPIFNGPGKDFTVFENAFVYSDSPYLVFEEWMIVSVSLDGLNWFTFPFDSISGSGFAGKTPTASGSVNFFDPDVSGGDAFDLDLSGMDTVHFVRLQDATRYQSPDRLSADLDAVLALHQVTGMEEDKLSKWYISVSNGKIFVSGDTPAEYLTLINLLGQSFKVFNTEREMQWQISVPDAFKGFVVCTAASQHFYQVRKLLLSE